MYERINEVFVDMGIAPYESCPTHRTRGRHFDNRCQVGAACVGVRREVCLTSSGGGFEELRRGISSATGCRTTGMKEAIGGNLWE